MSKKNITGIANIITNSHLNIKNIKNINKLQQTLKNLFEEEIISDHGINFINDSIENIIYIDDMFKIFDPNADYIDDMYITPIIDNNFQDIYMFYIVNLIIVYIMIF
jgi:dGTP triphosphohydrolase